MTDPEPNPVSLLTAILAALATPSAAAPTDFQSNPTVWPAIFYWKGGAKHHMIEAGGGDYSIGVEDDDGHSLAGHRNIIMWTRETGITSSDQVNLTKWLPVPASGFIRLRLALSCPYTNTGRQYDFWLNHHDGTNQYFLRWMLQTGVPINPLVMYINNAGVLTNVAGFTFSVGSLHWTFLDVCANLTDHTQYRLRVNHQTTDLANEAFFSQASPIEPMIEFSMRLKNLSTDRHSVYLDHVLITDEQVEAP